jgi:phage tail P2-like protein
MRDLQTVDLGDLIPPSIASDPQVQAAVQALNGELQSCTAQIEQTILISRIDELDSDTLDQLAWHYNVLFYNDGGTLAQKRAAIKRAIYWRRIAGTKAAVLDGIATLQYKPEVIEWWEFGGLPYTFKVVAGVSGKPVTDNIYDQVERVVEMTKNTRSHLVGVTIKSDVEGKVFIGAAAMFGEEIVVYPYNPSAAGTSGQLYYAAACTVIETVTVGP